MIDVTRVSDRIISMRLLVGVTTVTVISVYAPQTGLSDTEKEQFYDDLLSMMTKLDNQDVIVPCGDWNGHIGMNADGYEGVHGGYGYGDRNTDGERLLEFAVGSDCVISNSFFRKKTEHLITFESGNNRSQIDYILIKKKNWKLVKNTKVIPGEECLLQHRLLVCDLKLHVPKLREQKFVPRIRCWKLKEPATCLKVQEVMNRELELHAAKDSSANSLWSNYQSSLLKATEEICGKTTKRSWKEETWWWDDIVDKAVQEKRSCFKEWKKVAA